MSDDMLQIGLSGLQASQQAMDVTSHNIANVDTPGYTEEQAELSSVPTLNAGNNSIGQGVTVLNIQRLANNLLTTQLQQAQSTTNSLTQIGSTMNEAQSSFNEPGSNGLSSVMDSLFTSLQSLAGDPSSSALASATVAQLGTFTSTLNNLGASLQSQESGLGSSLQTAITTVNQLTSQIAGLNNEIVGQSVTGSPNDLIDQRNQLINTLAGYMNVQVNQSSNGSVNISSGGDMLVGDSSATQLQVGATNTSGGLAVLNSNGTSFPVSGGTMGALLDLSNSSMPTLITGLNTLTATLAQACNEVQATGTNSNAQISSFISSNTIAADQTSVNLNATTQLQTTTGGVGLTSLPSFTDSNGNPVTTNLTINVYDQATGTAQKYTVQYDPSVGDGGCSLDDLVSAINTGRSSGGFTLYPTSSGGISGVTATEQPVAGGVQLSLQAQPGLSIDFSPALDTEPTATAWTGGATTVTNSIADPSLANQRVVFQVEGGQLQAYTLNPANGAQIPYGSPLTLGGTSGAIGDLNLTLTAGAGSYQNGQSFAVDFDQNGNVEGGTYTQAQNWTQGDANMTVSGSYSGSQTFSPGTQWSMQVISPGTIGATTNAPVVQFSYYTGPANAPVLQTEQVVLDNTNPAGTPVQIADGVYATFGAGNLSTANNQVQFTVDSQPDQANLLSSLGIGGMFTGTTASTIQVSQQLQQDPDTLSVGTTRSAGDNANVQNFANLQQASLFNGGTTAVGDYYQSIITNLGVQVQQNTQQQSTQSALTTSLQNQLQQTSGVSIDQEVTNLIVQQQAYTAAARVISTEQANINTLMQMMQ